MKRYEFHATLEGLEYPALQFTDEEMARIPEDKLWYCLWGYDEDGYFQAGHIQGTAKDIDPRCYIEGGFVSREIYKYRHRFGDAFVDEIRREL